VFENDGMRRTVFSRGTNKEMGFALNRALGPLENTPTFPFGTWDIEASDWWNLQCIGAFDGNNYFHFRDIGAFLDYIMQKQYRNYRWFAHFGGRYDLNFVFDYLRNRTDCAVSFYCSGSMVIQMKIKRNGIITKLCDSYRLLPAALGGKNDEHGRYIPGLGDSFNVKHKKTSYDFAAMEYGKELIEYNEQDCRCLWECIDIFYRETGVQSETFATHSMKMFRKDHLHSLIWKPRQEVTDFVRPSYHGGRVEVFKSQHENLTAYDVNSMYPYVMQFPMPVEYLGESRTLSDSKYGFIDATVFIPDREYIPTLPYRNGKLYFPVGLMRGVWTAAELHAAEERGATIQTIHKAHYFHTDAIFKEYILKLYKLKKTAAEPTRTISKFLLNSFYGKFGQNPTKKVYCTESEAPHGAWPIITPCGDPTGYAFFERTSNAAYLLPHLASAVTSAARLHLLSSLSDASFYCDTDSIFTTETIETSNELGGWGLVGNGSAHFIQPKLYQFKGEWKSKGLNKKESIDIFVAGGINHAKRTKSIKEALQDGTRATQHVDVEKVLREERPKRAWDKTHNDTRPWDIKELRK
jgi:hypothetical protein